MEAKMRSIRVSDEVWDAIAAKGRFGETEDDVLRRVLGVKGQPPTPATRSVTTQTQTQRGQRSSPPIANIRMSADVRDNQLIVSFVSGARKNFSLPKRTDLNGIRQVRAEAVLWARSSGASPGQEDAVKKALTSAGYHIRGPRS